MKIFMNCSKSKRFATNCFNSSNNLNKSLSPLASYTTSCGSTTTLSPKNCFGSFNAPYSDCSLNFPN